METLSFAASFCEDASAVRVDKVDCVFEEVHLEPSRIVGSLPLEHSFALSQAFPPSLQGHTFMNIQLAGGEMAPTMNNTEGCVYLT